MKKNLILFLTSVAITTSLIPTNFVLANEINSKETKAETKANSEFKWNMSTVVNHFRENVDKYNVINPETELKELRSYNGTDGEYIVRFNPAFNGIRVPYYEFIVVFDKNANIKEVNGSFPEKPLQKLIKSEDYKSISETEAINAAREYVDNTEHKNAEEVELLYYKDGDTYKKVYCIKFPGYDKKHNEIAYWEILVSCKDGNVLDARNSIIFN